MDVLFDKKVDASILSFLTKVCRVVPPERGRVSGTSDRVVVIE